MTARDSMNHRVLSRRSKPENELFLSWTCCHYSEAGWPYAWGLGVYNCRLLHTTLLALLSKDMLPCAAQPSPTPVTTHHCIPSSSSLHHSLASILPTSALGIPSSKWHWQLQCVIQYSLLPKQLYIQIFIALSLWSGSRFLKHHKYWTIAEIQLEYSAVAQSRSDVAA